MKQKKTFLKATTKKIFGIIAVFAASFCLIVIIIIISLLKYQSKIIFKPSYSPKEDNLSFLVKKIKNESEYFLTPFIYNEKGSPRILGMTISEHGRYASLKLSEMGIEKIINPAAGGDQLSDYNGDGFSDLLRTTYSKNSYENARVLLFLNNGLIGEKTNTFSEHQTFSNLQLKGFTETAVSADFDNDGDLDIFIPMYSSKDIDPMGYSHLLVNNGRADFTDISDSAGVSIRNFSNKYRVEGAQAADINRDGWIDLYVGSHLFINNGNLTFTDRRKEFGLPLIRDEGIKFLDWNNDGYLDLMLNSGKLRLFEYSAAKNKFIDKSGLIPDDGYLTPYDLNAYDFNNDGHEDIFAGQSLKDYYYYWPLKDFRFLLSNLSDIKPSYIYNHQPRILINRGNSFLWSNHEFYVGAKNIERSARSSIGDINNDGLVDLTIMNEVGENYLFTNRTKTSFNCIFLNITGPNGEQNQQGRVATIQPESHSNMIMTRVVDGGSGYRTQNQYELTVGTPYNEPHIVTVYFSDGPAKFTINAGERKTIKSNGIIEDYK